ncbi:MAG: PD-(D/E)XK nuclease family protein, partial [Chloroflexia bacterium]|nr:PD-(D/E)XK nuclease family protein [Chloroflexia bacterium]
MMDGMRQRDLYPVLPNDRGVVPISPTDVSQFIRLEQCQRFLRLHLHEGTNTSQFLRDYGVRRQEIQPLLTRSGVDFEVAVVAAVRERDPLLDLANNDRRPPRGNDNAYVLSLIRDVAPGQVLVLYQPRLEAELGSWRIRGDIDLLRVTRDPAGALHLLIADIKSSAEAKVEHRLQVAFYHEILAALLPAGSGDEVEIETAVLYRGTVKNLTGTEEDAARAEHERREAARLFNAGDAYLEIVAEAESYRAAVRDLITDAGSLGNRVRASRFTEIPYHLTEKCDGCLYNEFCMTWSARHDDLSLLPHLTDQEKGALRQAGIERVQALATLKEASVSPNTGAHDDLVRLVPAAGQEARVQRLSATWPVGPRLDELIHRARAYRSFKGDPIAALSFIPSKGHGSLPYADAGHNPNLVRVYLDAQRDYLNDRVYLLGALVVGSERGEEPAARRRQIVRLSEEPPTSDEIEARLLVDWVQQTLRAIVAVAAPDETGAARAPIHLIFFNSFAQKDLLDALGRHSPAVLGATPLYDFMTQIAAFDSPIVSYLDREIRELKNYPMVCQSLQAVAAKLGFQWNDDIPYRDLFKPRLFDFWRKADEPRQGAAVESPWYFGRARFSSQIPLEYATAAWSELPVPKPGERDEFAAYRATTAPLLEGFEAKRLEAMEWIAKDFSGNKLTTKKPFDLPDLAAFDDRARGLAQALEEFLLIERHVELGAWKTARLLPPERRVLAGTTLLLRYDDADQSPEAVEWNRQNQARDRLYAEQEAAYRAAHPDEIWVTLTKDEKQRSKWSPDGLRVRLAMDLTEVDCGFDEALAVTTLRAGDRVVVMPRWTVDSRLAVAQQALQTPTPRQMLYGGRAEIREIAVERDETGRAIGAMVELEMKDAFGGPKFRGFAFGDSGRQPFVAGERYTIDTDPNDWASYQGLKVVEGLIAGQPNTLFDRLSDGVPADLDWPEAAQAGQARFLAGLEALVVADLALRFEPDQRAFVAGHGEAPTLLVQGPPGTGKSYTTAYALFARMQGAMAADREFRVQVGCKTHAATDVL